MLKITKSSEPITVSTITMCLYAPPGIGKTSMGFTASKPLLLDCDKGSYRAANRKDVVQVTEWADIEGITREDLAPYDTVIVDTAGRALDCLTGTIIQGNPKHGNGGALSLQGYGKLKSLFVAWTKSLRGMGKDIVLLCHSDESKSGDDLIERIDMQGGSKGEVYKAADAMGRISLSGQKRILNFSPTDTAFGKNPANMPPLSVPDYTAVPDFLAGVIRDIKASLNRVSAEGKEIAEKMAAWAEKVKAAKTMTDFDALLPPCREAPVTYQQQMKALLAKGARECGFAFNAATKAFDIAPPKKAA